MDYKSLIEDNQVLQHHGVKGMKWGRRKQQSHRDTPLPNLSSNTTLNNRNFRRLRRATKKFVKDYNHDAKQNLNSVGLNYRKVNRDGKKIEKIIAADYKKKINLLILKMWPKVLMLLARLGYLSMIILKCQLSVIMHNF